MDRRLSTKRGLLQGLSQHLKAQEAAALREKYFPKPKAPEPKAQVAPAEEVEPDADPSVDDLELALRSFEAPSAPTE